MVFNFLSLKLVLQQVNPSSEPSGQSRTPLQNLSISMQFAVVLHANLLGGQCLMA